MVKEIRFSLKKAHPQGLFQLGTSGTEWKCCIGKAEEKHYFFDSIPFNVKTATDFLTPSQFVFSCRYGMYLLTDFSTAIWLPAWVTEVKVAATPGALAPGIWWSMNM